MATKKPPAKWRPGMPGNPHAAAWRKDISAKTLVLIESLAAKGCREVDICRAAGVSYPTWSKLKAERPDIAKALADGQQQLHDRLVADLIRMSKKNVVPALFLLKTRYAYRENDAPADQRPMINIVLPGARPMAKLVDVAGVTPERLPQLPDAVTTPPATKGTRRG